MPVRDLACRLKTRLIFTKTNQKETLSKWSTGSWEKWLNDVISITKKSCIMGSVFFEFKGFKIKIFWPTLLQLWRLFYLSIMSRLTLRECNTTSLTYPFNGAWYYLRDKDLFIRHFNFTNVTSPSAQKQTNKNKTNTQMQSLQGYFPQCSAVLLWTFLTCTLGVCASSVHKEAAEFKIWNVCFCFYGVITYIGIWLLFFVFVFS